MTATVIMPVHIRYLRTFSLLLTAMSILPSSSASFISMRSSCSCILRSIPRCASFPGECCGRKRNTYISKDNIKHSKIKKYYQQEVDHCEDRGYEYFFARKYPQPK